MLACIRCRAPASTPCVRVRAKLMMPMRPCLALRRFGGFAGWVSLPLARQPRVVPLLWRARLRCRTLRRMLPLLRRARGMGRTVLGETLAWCRATIWTGTRMRVSGWMHLRRRSAIRRYESGAAVMPGSPVRSSDAAVD